VCSELSWPLDIAPNAHNIGLLAIQTSTPRNADCVLPPLKTPATDYHPHLQASAADEPPQAWHYQRFEADGNRQFEAHPNQFTPQPHVWSDKNDENDYIPNDTVRQGDLDRGEDDKTQYLYVDQEGHGHFANVDSQSRCHNGQTVVDQAQPVGPVDHELQSQMFAFVQPQQNECGQMFSDHHWNQQMYELQCEDATDVEQLETAHSRNYYSANVDIHGPYADDQRGLNAAVQPQWSMAATFPQVVSNAAQRDCMSVRTSAAGNKLLSTWPTTNVTVAPSREASGRSPTKTAGKGEGDFGNYRVQYRQQGRDQFHSVSAAGDGYQPVTSEKADSQTAAARTVPERLQQAFLHSSKLSFQLSSCCYQFYLVS